MATSSITHNFVISGKKNVERFLKALDESYHDPAPKPTFPGRELTDPQEILELMARRKKKHE